MTREIAHQQSFEKALYSMQPNFPPGKLPGMKQFSNVYFNMSNGGGVDDKRGPWNNEPTFNYCEAQAAVDGGSGLPEVTMREEERQLAQQQAARTRSDPQSDPTTGAELGMTGAAAPSAVRGTQP